MRRFKTLQYTLTHDEWNYLRACTQVRLEVKGAGRVHSGRPPAQILLSSGAGEIAGANLLGMLCHINPHRGGDGLRGDLRKGRLTVGVKSIPRKSPTRYSCSTRQYNGFGDDYGIVTREGGESSEYALSNGEPPTVRCGHYFSKQDWIEHHTGGRDSRIGPGDFKGYVVLGVGHMKDVEELVAVVSSFEDEAVQAAQERGFIWDQWDRLCRRGDSVYIGKVRDALAHYLPEYRFI